MNIRKARRITSALLIAGFLVSCSGFFFLAIDSDAGVTASWVTGVALIVAAAIIDHIYVRCPRCDSSIGRAWGKYCPFCGAKLEDDNKMKGGTEKK